MAEEAVDELMRRLRSGVPARIVSNHTSYPHSAAIDAATARLFAADLEE